MGSGPTGGILRGATPYNDLSSHLNPMTCTAPTPLKTILSPTRYPFAVAYAEGGAIRHTVAYAATLEECYAQVQAWRSYRQDGAYIMASMAEIGERTPGRVNTYWVAV